LGTLLLKLPISWRGQGSVGIIDALFTAVSAVCVTGLATVDTTTFSSFGQGVILFLIQAGGLGIISFSTLYLILPGSRISLKSRKIIRDYYASDSGVTPKKILKSIFLFTLSIELLGGLLLSFFLFRAGDSEPLFNGFFHAVSAFCNAGFSRYSDSFTSYANNIAINLTLMMLIILGGMGFMVIWDSLRNISDWRNRLHFHSKIMLVMTPLLIVLGWVSYFLLEQHHLLADLPLGQKVLSSLFQSVTTRTAGFNTIDQAGLSKGSFIVTLLLMIIGGGSGSTAGGLKVSTALLLFMVIIQRMNSKGESKLFNRRITKDSLSRASMLFLKALAMIFTVIFLLVLSEGKNSGVSLTMIVFEAISALGTVGLSQGLTGLLSPVGKGIIILTMFAGRVGLFALIMPQRDRITERHVDYPKGEVLIG
jgi:trk system potassium uptake protein TrkH